MFNNIMVPLDGSNTAEMVFPYVAAFASAFDAGVFLVTATESENEEQRRSLQAYLDSAVETIKLAAPLRGKLKVNAMLVAGKPQDEILKYAGQVGAGLFIIAGHGASGDKSPLLGNIADKLLASAQVPTLLINHPLDEEAKIQELVKRILVPLDGSRLSENSLSIVVPLAKKFKAELVLFQSVEPVRYIPGFDTMVPNVVLPNNEEIKNAATKYLSGIQDSVTNEGLKTSLAVVADSPAEAILDYADAKAIDLIAMTTHGLSGVRRWVFGSTTAKVLQASAKPVLVIPPGKAK